MNLVTTTQEEHDLQSLVDELLKLDLDGKIVGILHILNDSLSDVVKSDETRILYGQDFFYEKLLGLDFKITPFSFFQPNTRGAEVLYETVREYIGDIHDMTVFDLFSGTGTISQVLAPVAKQVVGVEIVEEAVDAAKENAARNGISNCKFIAGDVFQVLDELEEKPDVIVLDPPPFARTKDALAGALRGYKELNLRALKMLNPGGVLATYSCSQRVGTEKFIDVLSSAAHDARRRVTLLEITGQPEDHPALLNFPESRYLKGLILRAD